MSFAKAGILAGDGPVRPEDLKAVQQAGIEAVKLRAWVNPITDLNAYRDAGIHTFLVQILSPRPGVAPTSPEDFVIECAPVVAEFLKAGVTDFEIHGEPNTRERGYGVSWDSPAAFSDWFIAVAHGLRAEFGPPLRVGFPGLAPEGPLPPGVTPAVSDEPFLEACGEALAAADFVCCHVYWTSRDQMEDYHGALRFLRAYMERAEVRHKPLVISEFANVDPETSPEEKGDQYAEFCFLCSQYDRLAAAYGFLLRSPDPAYASLRWIRVDGTLTPIPERVGRRKRMPHPARLRLAWPTASRAYTQAFGDRQQVYYEASFDPDHNVHWLHGGHEGVDLEAAEGSPVRACLGGRVSHGPPGTAYGNYVRVTSQVSGVGRVTMFYAHLREIAVPNGAEVAKGAVLGLAGATGFATGPHLHLGMKIEGVRLRPTSHYLNARPYLDPVRGSPREPYTRTYVLLPPGADSRWAQAVVEATWDERRFTVGGSADDAGIGDLPARYVIAVNPAEWGGDLQAFYEAHYPGLALLPLEAPTPEALAQALAALPPMPAPPSPPPPGAGLPREQYARTYVLLPPGADSRWARAVVEATWDAHRFTVGGSADDAGIGDLDFRRVIAVNPGMWGDDLGSFFASYYPGVIYVPVEAETPEELAQQLEWFGS
ncbi:MAG TPA: M23 family metallopeptidase [Chloroflexi bacterium]|nr:M23 family metallopeptidase [Chloroflexota bacterium]